MRIRPRPFALAVLFWAALPAGAQYFIDLRSVRLSGEEWPPDPLAHALVVDSVILCSAPDVRVGRVLKGVANLPVNAFIKGDLRTELKDLLDRLRTGGTEGRHVTLKVDTIEISERKLTSREIAYCRFAGEVLERGDTGWTSLYAFGTTLMRAGGMDATDDHGANIAHALDNCLRRTVRAIGSLEDERQPISAHQLDRPHVRQLGDVRSLQGARTAKGIYYSFMDLVDHTPDTTTEVSLKPSSNATELTRVVNLKGANWDLKAWGISDGERLYVNTGQEYNEVTIGPEGMRTYWTPPGGGGTADVMPLGSPLGEARVWPGYTGAPVRLDLELTTGSFHRVHGTAPKARDTEHWFYFSRHSAVDTIICLFVPGGAESCLRKGQHHIVRLAPQAATVPVEVRYGDRVEQVALDTKTRADQVYLVSVKDDGTLKVSKLGSVMAGDLIEQVEPENEVK